jgi:hypothetical protein
MKRDQILVERFLWAYNSHYGTSFRVVRWPDEMNRKTAAVEAVASNEFGETVAIEHTLIEPFEGEREDTDRFIQVFSRLEGKSDLIKPGHDVDVAVKVGVIPTGVSWDSIGDRVHRHLAARIPSLGEGQFSEIVTGLNFPLEVSLAISVHEPQEKDHVWISRHLPKESIENVVRTALTRKLPKLVAEQATTRILLFEKADIARGHTDIRVALDKLSRDFAQLAMIDEVWVVITHSWQTDDALFYIEISPELGGRRLMMESASTAEARVKVLGAATGLKDRP